MLATALAAVGMAGLLNSSAVWAIIAQTAVTIMLLLAFLGVIYRTGKSRAMWAGFAIFAWGYLVLSVYHVQRMDTIANLPLLAERFLIQIDLKRKLRPHPGEYADLKVYDADNGIRYRPVKVIGSDNAGFYKVARADGTSDLIAKSEFRQDNEEFYLIVGKSIFHIFTGIIGWFFGKWFYSHRNP